MTTRLAAMIAVFISIVAAVVDGIKVPVGRGFGQRIVQEICLFGIGVRPKLTGGVEMGLGARRVDKDQPDNTSCGVSVKSQVSHLFWLQNISRKSLRQTQ